MPPRILVVEDEYLWGKKFEEILKGMGCAVQITQSHEEAKASLREARHDLVLLDVCLKGSTITVDDQLFWEFLKRECPNLPIVAVTGQPLKPPEVFLLAKSGVNDFIFKPEIRLPNFRQRIWNALRKPPPGALVLHNAYALLIGVGNYTHSHFADLPCTAHDVQAIAAILTSPARCGYPTDNVQIVTGTEACAANVRISLKRLAQLTNPESTALVYFSGHGGRALENGAWCTYLCPREADPNDLAHTAISGNEFSDMLSTIPACKLLVVLDACHASGSAALKTADSTFLWKASMPACYYKALSQGSGRVIIASSKADQVSLIRPQGDLSLFTWHLVEGLKGAAAVHKDGFVRVLDLYYYVSQRVKSERPNQEPVLHARDIDDNFPIALASSNQGLVT